MNNNAYAEVLIRFCQVMGIARENLISVDNFDGFKLRIPLMAADAQRLTPEILASTTHVFGTALNVKIFISGDSPLLKVHGGVVDNVANSFVELKQRDPATSLQIEIEVDKREVVRSLQLPHVDLHPILFFFHEAFLRFFKSSSLLELDELLFTYGQSHICVFVSDASYIYKGDLLSVIGLAANNSATTEILSANKVTSTERVIEHFKIARENLGWVGFRLKNLTPQHFMYDSEYANDPEVEIELLNRLLDLCVVFTANRTEYNDHEKTFLATYASADKTSSLLLEPSHMATEKIRPVLFQFAKWPYDGRPVDRLIILQNVMARQLWLDDPVDNTKKLCNELKLIIADADRHYRIYTDGKINKHFEIARALSDYIAGIARDVSGSVDTVTKGLSESLFATIGFVVVTIIAALIKGETQDIVFSIGMKAYAVYVLLFQLLYRMSSVCGSYSLLQKECDSRIAEYASSLYLSSVDVKSLTAPLQRRRVQFIGWAFVTIIIYILVAVSLVWLSNPANITQIVTTQP